MPPIKDHTEPQDIKSESVNPVQTFHQPQRNTDAMVRGDGVARPPGNGGSEPKKYTCPPWSWHCRPFHSPSINTTYSHPLPPALNATGAGVPFTNNTGNGTGSKVIVDERTGLKPDNTVLPITATISTTTTPLAPSPTWPGPNIAGMGPEEVIQATKEIFKQDGGELCILYKDLITGSPVERCEPRHSGGVSGLAKRDDHDDLLAKILKNAPMDLNLNLNDSKCFLTSEPSSHRVTINCPPGESMKLVRLDSTELYPIAVTSPVLGNYTELRTRDTVLMVFFPVVLIGCLAYQVFDQCKKRSHRLKKLEKRKQSKMIKQSYPMDTKPLPASNDVVEVKTLPTKPEQCLMEKPLNA